jgi:hypothetical protein
VWENDGIEPRTVETLAVAASDALATRPDLIHLIHRRKCVKPIGEIFPTPPFSLCSWIADYGVDYEIIGVIEKTAA